jgi:hypothetical protein
VKENGASFILSSFPETVVESSSLWTNKSTAFLIIVSPSLFLVKQSANNQIKSQVKGRREKKKMPKKLGSLFSKKLGSPSGAGGGSDHPPAKKGTFTIAALIDHRLMSVI